MLDTLKDDDIPGTPHEQKRADGSHVRSVITCDLEGRIETFNEGAQQIFGYTPGEVVGKKRVSLFSPGLVVLGHVQNWLKQARDKGEIVTRTVFVGKDGKHFPARIRITPTFRRNNGVKEHIGYCGLTEPLSDVSTEAAMPSINFFTRVFAWLVILRAPFLTATIMPILIGAVLVNWNQAVDAFPWVLLLSALIGACALHISANLFNDYFDWRSGADPANTDYIVPYSGGSRAIELRLITEQGTLRLAVVSLILALLAATPIVLARGQAVFAFGLAGAFLAYFYTAPPLRLSARRGLGELSVGLAFGPLLVAGTVFGLSGTVDTSHFIVGIPIGLLTVAILWVNEFPDIESDAIAGKNTLVVTLGREAARWGYILLVLFAYLSVALLVITGLLTVGALAVFLSLPLAFSATRNVFVHYHDRELIDACSGTIRLHLMVSLLLVAGILFSD
ncbi:MAG: 1,4-dihydroxy-2-naphthoate octaprenyltransferase [Gammaproteobacteria bacterium]|nr:1,4-dihydroxy-2-naphthoate octaprenyltransferase [Gammaproteobacteria bacterium]